MDYGLPKTLPATGAATIVGLSLTDQIWIVGAVFAGTFLIASLIRALWRRHTSIGE